MNKRRVTSKHNSFYACDQTGDDFLTANSLLRPEKNPLCSQKYWWLQWAIWSSHCQDTSCSRELRLGLLAAYCQQGPGTSQNPAPSELVGQELSGHNCSQPSCSCRTRSSCALGGWTGRSPTLPGTAAAAQATTAEPGTSPPLRAWEGFSFPHRFRGVCSRYLASPCSWHPHQSWVFCSPARCADAQGSADTPATCCLRPLQTLGTYGDGKEAKRSLRTARCWPVGIPQHSLGTTENGRRKTGFRAERGSLQWSPTFRPGKAWSLGAIRQSRRLEWKLVVLFSEHANGPPWANQHTLSPLWGPHKPRTQPDSGRWWSDVPAESSYPLLGILSADSWTLNGMTCLWRGPTHSRISSDLVCHSITLHFTLPALHLYT